MPMPVEWYDKEHTIIKVTIQPNSTWDDYYEAVRWIEAEITKVDHVVDMIFYEESGMPKGNPMPHLKWGTTKIINIPNSGHTIITGATSYTNAFTRLIMTSLGNLMTKTISPYNDKKLVFLSSLEEALAFIHKEREKSEAKEG